MLTPLLINAQKKNFKLVEKNPSAKPSWLSEGSGNGFFLEQTIEAESLEDAKNMVMSSLLSDIASSVAVQVTGEMINETDWTYVDDKDDFKQRIQNSVKTKIAKMPALQGVSISKADIYWERYYNKKTKASYYNYYIRYPMSRFELEQLISDYKANEKMIDQKINDFRKALSTINDIEKLELNIKDMNVMLKDMDPQEKQYINLNNVIGLYRKMLNDIYIEVVTNESGHIAIQLKYDQKTMKTSTLPKVGSKCAKEIVKEHNGDLIEIRFNSFDCYEQDDNYIEIFFNFGKKIKEYIPIVI